MVPLQFKTILNRILYAGKSEGEPGDTKLNLLSYADGVFVMKERGNP
jgi:hypothetical protein